VNKAHPGQTAVPIVRDAAVPESPRAALRKTEALVAAMPEAERQAFGRTISFLRTSCVKKGGNGVTGDYSRMGTPYGPLPQRLPCRL
jgi:hypothetical protein